MRAKVIKRFGYSHNGIDIKELAPGAIEDFHDRHIPGLVAAGYLSLIDAANAPSTAVAAEQADDDLTVKHIGRGRYAVFSGDTRLTEDALDKDEAEAALAAMR